MLNLLDIKESASIEIQRAADVFRIVLLSLVASPRGGRAAFQEKYLQNQSWMWIEDHRQENRVWVEFRHGMGAEPLGVRFPPNFKFKASEPTLQTEVWEGDQSLTASLIDDLILTLNQILTLVFELPDDFVITGWVQTYFPWDKDTWAYRTTLIQESLRYTVLGLRKLIEENPGDEKLQLYLAERTEDWQEKVEILRSLYHSKDHSLEMEAKKAWDRLRDLIPSSTRTDCSSIQLFQGWEKLNMDTSQGDWFAEEKFEVFDCDSPGKPFQQGFSGGVGSRGYVLIFDRIIQLASCHFLCKQGDSYILYASPDGYFLYPAGKVPMLGEPTPDKVLLSVAKNLPQAYDFLKRNLYKAPDREDYISHYHSFAWGFDDFSFGLADGRVIMDDHFQTRPLDLFSASIE
jgi:hypothetical protein